jgi:predicted phage-related endonuclease
LFCENLRGVGLTACDAAAACGIGRYARPKALWEVKSQIIERNTNDNEATRHGKKMESLVGKFYELHSKNIIKY